ncbi:MULTISPECIES: A24 family peptidase [unclassified Actinomyces]|uniref:prepilin peptidase n=1 Tax=unclassified Actinomyces TaxID=2609248 RepID=UPI000D58CEE5|nr:MULTISPECIES: A24 family peptidase [unclassified Actinomyces]RAX24133.1 prepilin peptidase [Actinomyces sp. Z3]
MVNAAAVLPVVAVCLMAVASVGVAVWPASGFARGYVDRLEQASEEDAGRSDAATGGAGGNGADETAGEDGRAEAGGADGRSAQAAGAEAEPIGAGGMTDVTAVRVRSRGLLERRPQGVLAAILCAVTLAWGLGHGAVGYTALALPVVALLGVAGSVDAVCHRLPNRLLGTAALWLVVAIAGRSLVRLVTVESVHAALWPAGRATLCALGAGAAVFAMWLIPASGMGLGDVKLCALLGLWLGYIAVDWVVAGLLLGFILAGLVAIGLLVTRRAGRKDTLAFGPYLAAGGWLAWLLAMA